LHVRVRVRVQAHAVVRIRARAVCTKVLATPGTYLPNPGASIKVRRLLERIPSEPLRSTHQAPPTLSCGTQTSPIPIHICVAHLLAIFPACRVHVPVREQTRAEYGCTCEVRRQCCLPLPPQQAIVYPMTSLLPRCTLTNSLQSEHTVRCLANKRPMHHLRCQPLSEGPPCTSNLITESILASSNYCL
jgi:hypothetical protein